jgi:phenylalanyl-tRNA synthetase beta chain
LLCFEGIALMLNIFLERKPLPEYKLVPPANGQMQQIIVKEDVGITLWPCWRLAC